MGREPHWLGLRFRGSSSDDLATRVHATLAGVGIVLDPGLISYIASVMFGEGLDGLHCGYCGHRGVPHEWAIGRTFTFTITLPEPSNAGGRPPSRSKPAGKTPRKSSPKAQLTKQRLEPADTAGVDTKRGNPLKQEQKERAKKNAQEKRRQAKEFGLCRDCPNPAIPQQSRCEQCAEKHRVSRRQWQAERKQKRSR